MFLGIEGLWEIVCGDEDRPEAKAAQATWVKSNRRAYAFIYFLISPNLRNPIVDLDLGSEAWKKLCEKFETDKASLRLMLRQRLYSLHHDAKNPVTIFIDAVRTITRQLNAIGRVVADDEIGDLILLGLDKSFVPIRSALLARKTPPTLTEIIDAIEAFEASERVATRAHLEPETSYGDTAMYASSKRAPSTPADTSAFDWGNTARRPNVCERCGRSGHTAPRCFADMPHPVRSAMLQAHLCQTETTAIESAASVVPGNDDELFAFVSHFPPSPSSSTLSLSSIPTVTDTQSPTSTSICDTLEVPNEGVHRAYKMKGKRKKKRNR